MTRHATLTQAVVVSTLIALFALAGTVGFAGTAAADHGNTSVTFDDQTATTTVVVSNVTLKNDGYVAIHDESIDPEYDALGESIIGVSEYLSPGTHRNVTVTLYADVPGQTFDRAQLAEDQTLTAVPYGETNASEGNTTFNWITHQGDPDVLDSPYEYDTGDFSFINDTAEVTVGNANGSDGGTTTEGEGTTTEGEGTTTEGEGTTTEDNAGATDATTVDGGTTDAAGTTAEGAPGFTALVAVVALVGAALLAARRE